MVGYQPNPWEQSLFAYMETPAFDPAIEAQCKSPDHLRWLVVAQRAQERERLKLLTYLGLRARKAQDEVARLEGILAPETPEDVSMWLDAAVCQPVGSWSARWHGTAEAEMKRLRHATCASLSGWGRDAARTFRAHAAWNRALAEFGAQQQYAASFDGLHSLPAEQRVLLAIAEAGAAHLALRALRARRLVGKEAHTFYLGVHRTPAAESIEAVRSALDALLAG